MDNSIPPKLIDVKELLESITKECVNHGAYYRPTNLSACKSYKILRNSPLDFKIDMMHEVLNQFGGGDNVIQSYRKEIRAVRPVFRNILSALFREKKMNLPEFEIEEMIRTVSAYRNVHFWEFPYNVMIKKIHALNESNNFSKEVIDKLVNLKIANPQWGVLKVEERTYNAYIEKMIADQSGDGKNILDEDDFGTAVHLFLRDLSEDEFDKWKTFCSGFKDLKTGTKPTKTWLKKINKSMETHGK